MAVTREPLAMPVFSPQHTVPFDSIPFHIAVLLSPLPLTLVPVEGGQEGGDLGRQLPQHLRGTLPTDSPLSPSGVRAQGGGTGRQHVHQHHTLSRGLHLHTAQEQHAGSEREV